MYGLIRKALFQASPEAAHEWALESLRLGYGLGATALQRCPAGTPVEVMGLTFPNAVGLAAGMDKNGDYIDALGSLGFGFIEVGTVTPRPQPGNPKPRVFRLESAGAMINRLGFNNKGVDHLVERAAKRRYKGILGINIGKNADTPIEQAAADYLHCLERVYPHADYVTVNISSPNTQGLRDLQSGDAFEDLVSQLARRRAELADEHGRCVPLAVKVAPELDDVQMLAIARVVGAHRIDAVIATNTTIRRPGVRDLPQAREKGGLSGPPLARESNRVLAGLRAALPRELALIGVGGIASGEDAARKRALGADLVQFYTGFVYRGPKLVADCIRALA